MMIGFGAAFISTMMRHVVSSGGESRRRNSSIPKCVPKSNLHPLLVAAEGDDEESVGILILRNKFLRRAFIIDAISGANSAVAVDAIGEIQRRRSRLVDERSEKDNHSLPTNSLHGRKGAIFVFLNGFDRYVDLVGGLIFLAPDLPGCPRRSRVFQPLRFCLLPLALLQRGARF